MNRFDVITRNQDPTCYLNKKELRALNNIEPAYSNKYKKRKKRELSIDE